MSDTKAMNVALEGLKRSWQIEVGSGFRIERMLAVSPVMIEARVFDVSLNKRFSGRFYPVEASQRALAEHAWERHGAKLIEPGFDTLQPVVGVMPVGRALACVAEYTPGPTLALYLRAIGRSRPDYAVRLMVEVLAQLEKLTAQGVHHWQLGPADITIGADGRATLRNAGLYPFEREIAKLMGVAELVDPRYAAPEQLQNKPLTESADVYSAAAVLFEAIAGRPVFEGGFEAVREGHLNKSMPNPQSFNEDVNVGMARVLMRALAKKPEQRFASVAELRQALEFLLPARERAARLADGPPTLDERDSERARTQIEEAKTQAHEGDFQAALRTLDALLTTLGPLEEALNLNERIAARMYSDMVDQRLEETRQALAQKRPGEALERLNALLALQPRHPQGLKLQLKLFERLMDAAPRGRACIQFRQCQQLAGEARSRGNLPLAELLLSQIMMAPGGADPKIQKNIQFERQLALPELTAIQEEIWAKAPAEEPPPPVQETPDLVEIDGEDAFASGVVDPAEHAPPPPADAPRPATDEFATQPAGLPEEPAADSPEPPAPAVEEAAPESVAEPSAEPAAEPSAVAPPAKKKRPLVAILAAAAVVVVVVAAVLIFLGSQKAKKAREQAAAAYNQADALEQTGDWDAAMTAWEQVASDHPSYANVEERRRTLEYKVRDRDAKVATLLAEAERQMAAQDADAGLSEAIADPIREALSLHPDNRKALSLMESMRAVEMERAVAFWDAGQKEQANAVYRNLQALDQDFHDQAFEARMDSWVQEEVLKPGLVKLERLIKRKKWDEAFELSDSLREQVKDHTVLNQRWDQVYLDYQGQYQAARQKGSEEGTLAALNVMTRIRPEDAALAGERNKLSRDLNLSKILAQEQSIKTAYQRGRLQEAGLLANKLLRMESENAVAKDTLANVRRKLEKRAKDLSKSDPRKAMTPYNALIKVFNWKSHRSGRDALRKQIDAFDRQASQIEKSPAASYAQSRQTVNAFLDNHALFAKEDKYARVKAVGDAMDGEKQRLDALRRWEQGVRGDNRTSYASALSRLVKEKPFRFKFAKDELAKLKSAYRGRIENYAGSATLMIRGAANLPREKRGFNRAPDAFCELRVANGPCATEVIQNEQSPKWNHACRVTVSAGERLVFRLFEQDRQNKTPIGEVSLPKLPKDGKGIVLSHPDGWSLTIDVKRDR